jgi:hypothetical protein
MFKCLPLWSDLVAHLWRLTEKCNALVVIACPGTSANDLKLNNGG